MRFMLFMLPNIPPEGDYMPTPEAVATMSKYNDELTKAGVLLALDGLHPPTEGHRVHHQRGKARVIDGPFYRSQGGYRWLLDHRREVQGGGARVGQTGAGRR